MSFVGADSDQLDGLSWQLGRHAQELETIRGILGRQIYTAPWSGAAADRFRDRWSGTDAPAAAAAARFLRGAAGVLRQNALEQRVASAPDQGTSGLPVHAVSGDAVPKKRRDLPDPKPDSEHKHAEKKNFYRAGGIYPIDGAPKVNDVDQGELGDCYLMAALSALAYTANGSDLIRQMIKDNGDGTYTVSFPDRTKVMVDAEFYVTDRGGPLYAGNEQSDAMQGNWAQNLEKAYAMKRGGSYQGIVNGNADEVWRDLGYQTGRIDLNPDWDLNHLFGSRDPSDGSIAKVIRDALKDGRPIVASAHHGGEGHQLTITGIKDGYVTLRNPWASNPWDEYDPKTDKFVKISPNRNYLNEIKANTSHFTDLESLGDGYFEIRLDDFTAAFSDIQYVK